MKAIDTHCHISHTLKRGLKLNVMLDHMSKNNVIAAIDSPVYFDDYLQTKKFHDKYPKKIFATLGASPANYHEMDIDKIINSIRTFAEKKDIVGIGEVGLDYYWIKNEALRKKQHDVFKRFIELANEILLPLIIHSREAEKDAVADLAKAEVPVIMHSFGGDIDIAKECMNRGYYISIPTSVTTRKKNRQLAEKVPLENLLVETDSPYLSPFPEERHNEPANVIYAIKEIAKIKGGDEGEVARVIFETTNRLFKLSLL